MARPKGQALTPKDIVEAAIVCLEKDGESALGVNRVARELGIQPPSIYKHLAGNEALRRAVALEIWQRFLTFHNQKTQALEEPNSLLRAVGQTLREFAHLHPNWYTVMTRTRIELNDPDFAPIVQEVTTFYLKALQPYDFAPNELIDAIRMLHSAFHGFIEAERSGLFLTARSLDATYERIINTLIESLKTWKADA